MRKTISSTVNYFVIVNATKADCTQNIRYSICMYTYRTEYLHQRYTGYKSVCPCLNNPDCIGQSPNN